MSVIEIKGLRQEACHGVLESEKVTPQPFVFDICLDFDGYAAAQSDDLAQTVNYAEVCRIVADFCRKNRFNLIEKLSYGAAYLIMERFENIKRATVTVHKPEAPIPLPFDDVSATATVERNTVVLSLGSSVGDKEATLKGAIAALAAIDGISIEKVSGFISTAPYGGVACNTFLNCALIARCLLPPERLLDKIHETEAAFGRERKKRWDDRTLDIDIVFFGDKIITEDGLCIPHPDYVNRDFVLKPLKQIAPDFVCPLLHKRISDL